MDWYRAFAERQFKVHRAKDFAHSVRFFRQSRDHMLLWIIVMRGHYADKPPSIKEIIVQSRSSKDTVRSVLASAEQKGYVQVEQSSLDRRQKMVRPGQI